MRSNITLNAGIDANVWAISEHHTGFPLSVTNIFCGAFCGWERSIQWLVNNRLLHVQRSVALDACDQTMQIWQLRTGAAVVDTSEKIRHHSTDLNLGIRMQVSNDKWLNANVAQSNNVCTASPPCQPWCKGGRSGGLATTNGISFIHCIQKIKQMRPIFVCTECADSTPQHDHFAVIRKCFEFSGYGYYWSSVVPFEHICPMFRTRWLAVWIRHDVRFDGFRGNFRISDVHRKSWNDEAFNFSVPDQIQHQLTLKNDLCLIYGDYQLLPQGKKSSVASKNPSVDAVLQARCIRDDQPLPTLVASYTQQHNLDMAHLRSKGIYAYLIRSAEGYAFVDPFRFASLLGATKDEIVALPVKTEYAFRNLGNAISIPHALLTILVGVCATQFSKANIIDTIRLCWNDKITAFNSIVCRNGDFAFIVPHAIVAKTIVEHCIHESTFRHTPEIVIGKRRFGIKPNETLGKFFARCGIDVQQQKGLFVVNGETTMPWNMPLQLLVGDECVFMHKYQTVFRFTCVHPNTEQEVDECDSLDNDIGRIIDQIENNQETSSCVEPTIPYEVDVCQNAPKVKIQHDLQGSGINEVTSTQLTLYDAVHWDHFRRCIVSIEDITHKVVFTSGKPTLTFQAITKLPCDSVAARIPFFDPQCNEQYNIYEASSLSDEKICAFIATPKSNEMHQGVPIIIHDQDTASCIAKLVNKHEVPWNVIIRDVPGVTSVMQNNESTNMFIKVAMTPGDVLTATCKKRRIDSNNQKFSHERAERFRTDGISLASDEMNWAIQNLRQHRTNCEFQDKTDIDGATAFIVSLPFVKETKTTICPILQDGHWCACEIHHGSEPQIVGLNFKDHDKTRLNEGLHQLGFSTIPVVFARSPIQDGYCGWSLLHRWTHHHPFWRILPSITSVQQSTQIKADEIIGMCPPKGPEVPLWSFAARIRLSFLEQQACQPIATAIEIGAVGTEKTDTVMRDLVDPIFESDPWAPPKDRKMCKWEDLKMPNDHHFKLKSGDSVTQVHRQQLNDNAIGIAFATRAHVTPLFTGVDSKKVALLIPASDKPSFDELPKISITGPFEVVVHDSALGTIYKRQVLLIQHADEISFQLPKPSYSANPPALTEIVLEVDERLLSKDSLAGLIDRPLEFFKKKFVEQLPSITGKQLHIYAFRTIRAEQNRNAHRIFQAMTKVSSDKRNLCIERSGIADLFIRDFIPKGSCVEDITTLPRFWNVDKAGQADALKASNGVEGYAGLTLTRRGIAIRSYCTKLASMRKAILADDDRVCQLNLATVPKITYESTGWPATIAPSEVVKAVYHEVKAAPIPTRCYKILGVTTWSLAFDSKPSITRFLCQLNGESHEIILTPAQEKQQPIKQPKKAKGDGKGKSKAKHEVPPSHPKPKVEEGHNTESRLTALEVKFGTLERRQDSLETRINEGFGSVNDQLRQVLNCIQPRSANDHTGSTPPPKHPKLGN